MAETQNPTDPTKEAEKRSEKKWDDANDAVKRLEESGDDEASNKE